MKHEMRKVIYYPTFEIENENWLKFALLYLDKLCPIIPEAAERYLSDQFKKLCIETDLIQIHRPNYDDGYPATLDAIDHVEKILKNPDRYKSIFQTSDIVKKWQDPNRQKAVLFEEKYTIIWKDFCYENKLCKQTDQGLVVADDLAYLYMTLLAQTIADAKGISPITDSPTLDRFAIFTRCSDPADIKTVKTAQAVIELNLPANLSEISVDSIIKYRKRQGFKERMASFHKELDKFMANTEEGKNPGDFTKELGNVWSDYRDDIIRVGTGVATFSLGVWLFIESGANEPLKIMKEVAGGLSLIIGSTISIKNNWKHTLTKKCARKYLTDLKRLKPISF
jgi:hypothetical protein